MADVVNVGLLPNDGTGMPDRDAFIAINAALAAAAQHAADKANPHGVTAAQVGAFSKAEVSDRLAALALSLSNPQSVSQTVATAIAALVNSSPATLDTLNELAAALGNDPNFATTVMQSLALKAPLVSPVFSGTPTAPTPLAGASATRVATVASTASAARRAALIFG